MTDGFLNLCFKLRFLRAPAVSNPRLLSRLVPVASRLMRILFAVCLFVLAATVSHQKESRVAIAYANDDDRDSRYITPFVPTPEEVVVRMLELAEITPGDVLYDLGSGDGRIVIAAAKRYGIKAVGFEINPSLVEESRRAIKQEGLENLVEIREQDIRSIDLSPASVVTMYLYPNANLRLRRAIRSQLKPGSRVVSHKFGMGDWTPVKTEQLKDSAGLTRTIYLWRIAASRGR
jgi:SAM-dependent methyltransferase